MALKQAARLLRHAAGTTAVAPGRSSQLRSPSASSVQHLLSSSPVVGWGPITLSLPWAPPSLPPPSQPSSSQCPPRSSDHASRHLSTPFGLQFELQIAEAPDFGGPRARLPFPSCGLSTFASGFSMPVPKRLEEIMPLHQLLSTDAADIPKLWSDYHIGRTHIGTSLTADEYNLFRQRSQRCPMFVLPVPRDNGFVSMLVQVQGAHVLVTGLEDYKVRGVASSPFLTVSHYDDLVAAKELVLVRGDVVLPGKLRDDEARLLLERVHKFYIRDDWYKLVETFNKRSQDFEYNDVLRVLGMSY